MPCYYLLDKGNTDRHFVIVNVAARTHRRVRASCRRLFSLATRRSCIIPRSNELESSYSSRVNRLATIRVLLLEIEGSTLGCHSFPTYYINLLEFSSLVVPLPRSNLSQPAARDSIFPSYVLTTC
jgi:hypothetical protein